MNVVKRAFAYLIRNKFYSIVLSVIIFLLGTLALVAVFTTRMISSVEENLWNNLPNVVMIEHDQYASEKHFARYNIWPAPTITKELINEISRLPYVETAHAYLEHELLSRDLERYPGTILNDVFSEDGRSLRTQGIMHIEVFSVNGVTDSNFAALSTGIIEIVEGSTFITEQIENIKPVAIISNELAAINNLHVGSIITLESLILQGSVNISNRFNAEYIIDSLILELEVIGIYNLQGILTEFVPMQTSASIFGGGEQTTQKINMLNTIYIPYGIIQQVDSFDYEAILRIYGERIHDRNINNLIILKSAQDFPAFYEAMDEIFPDFITARNVSYSFPHVFVAMDNIRSASSFALVFLIGASLTVFTILLLLTLRIRRYEVGIYLALGERKGIIGLQFIIEILAVTVVAITMSLLLNHVVGSQISHLIISREMTGTVHGQTRGLVVGNSIFLRNEYLFDWFVPEVSEIEGLLEVFDISLGINDIALFYAAAIGVIILATSISLLSITHLKPKEILTFSERG